ncbi:MAG: Asp23/Gls24 family envelope stress response protein [Anaerolineae bacterium]|nr:Asp23/Gls24 family envelope stress response protein [Anaerolineae bacterium]
MDEQTPSSGRIEVAPEVLTTIARLTAIRVEGVSRLLPAPSEMGQLFRRSTRQEGVVLHWSDNSLSFDLYVIMEPNVSLVETSRNLQRAIIEAIDTMVGIPVTAVNVHVEDVLYSAEP